MKGKHATVHLESCLKELEDIIERRKRMRNLINLIKCVLFLGAGLLIIFFPYDKFKAIFPNAPSPVVVKVMGIIILLCGAFIVLLFTGL